MSSACAIVFSGGTDSLCAASLMAEKFDEVHLLTYYEQGTRGSVNPQRNVDKLRAAHPGTVFVSRYICCDSVVRFLSYHRYLYFCWKYRSLNLATCGFSSLSWHFLTLLYCLKHDIAHVADGLTRELMQFPGHMDKVVALLGRLYGRFGIEYANPVRDWQTPPDQQFMDRLLVDQHGFAFPWEDQNARKTTGRYLYKKGILPHPNVKGSSYDRSMQHDCYPFVLYNMIFFWIHLNFSSYDEICDNVALMMAEKIDSLLPYAEKFAASRRWADLEPLVPALDAPER